MNSPISSSLSHSSKIATANTTASGENTEAIPSNAAHLDKEQLIFITSQTDSKIYIREQKGYFQQIRRSLNVFLIALFVVTPFIRFNGQQAVQFDIGQQQLHLFGFTLFPQDMFIFSLVFMLAAFLLFYVTKLYGRVWCGFSCPQTVWMLMFNWIERRVEGTHNQSKVLDKQGGSLQKSIKKVMKHTLWATISLLTALVFMSYFIPVEQLYLPFLTFSASSLTVSWVMFFAICTYVNAGWIRDKMCQHMCPYSRFQSAMFDSKTKLVTYDGARGEYRGKRKRNLSQDEVKKANLGDCVDCNLCVQVCPVGIDIRNGLQYECINCGLCVDACNDTMDKFNYERDLITFASEENTIDSNNWQRHLGYGAIIVLTLFSMLFWGLSWQSVEVNILRDRQALYRINNDGKVENTYVFKMRNKTNQQQEYSIDVAGFDGVNIIGKNTINVMPGELKTASVTVEAALTMDSEQSAIRFAISNSTNDEYLEKKTTFYSGTDGW